MTVQESFAAARHWDQHTSSALRDWRVLIVERMPIFRLGLERALGREAAAIVETSTVRGALEEMRNGTVNLVIIGWPGDASPEETIAALRQEEAGIRFVVLISHAHEDRLLSLLRLGVEAILPRSLDIARLHEALRVVATGGRLIDDRFLPVIAGHVRARPDTERRALSRRELEVLEYLASGTSAAAIARELHVALPTVKTHIASIYRKLGAGNRSQAIRNAFARGLLR